MSTISPKQYIAIIPAAGVGQRMGADRPKQYLDCLEQPMIWHTLNRFQQCDWIEKIYVPISADDGYWAELMAGQLSKVEALIGGDSRAESVVQGLVAAQNQHQTDSWVLVHDAARPCLSVNDLERIHDCIESANTESFDGLILADKVHDTVKKSDSNGCIQSTEDRSLLWRAQTPQVFQLGRLLEALQQADLQKVTDEASAVEMLGDKPLLLQGDSRNIKVTTAQDLTMAEIIIQQQEQSL